ncbi:Dynein beta chain like protein [Argiope bruennichi]|uniref:Dynein beta chain like protein n=1 Tax=Argiope bruennichi TaxID=94029 RepID=A0A8T0E8E5_ARGBR|nr:Dynein beta chain like protein [Argiope bruennichi]
MTTPESEDSRIEHIQITSQQVLNYDISHWKELIWKEENQAILKDFFDTPATILLLVYFDKNDKLTFSIELPKRPPLSPKMCFFLKNNIVISMENYKEEIIFGNICDFPLIQYQELFGKVIAPIFCNPKNNSRWPDEIAQDIGNHFQDFKTILSYHIGLAEEKTFLMIPERAKLIQNFDIDGMSESNSFDWKLRNILNSITCMLSDWIPIVEEVLELTPEHILSQIDQGPNSEILFWQERMNNLEYIYAQINDPLVQKMALALEKTKNCHFPNFKLLLQEVAEGLDEAREICENFTAMSVKLEELDSSSVPDLIDLLPNTLELITSSWMQSKYYRSVPSRIIVLVQKICCLLIEKINHFLDPMNLFKSDRDNAKNNMKLSLDIVNLFLKSYYECRERAEHSDSKTKLYPWEFPDERIFSHFENFIQRLEDIHEIFLAAEVYFNIPCQKLTSIQQSSYKKRLKELQSKFAEIYKLFEFSSYNVLDLHCVGFVEDFDTFSIKLKELDPKLGIVVGQLCLVSSPVEDAFKIIDIFQDVLRRPLAEKEFRKLISSHISNIYADFLHAKHSYRNFITLLEKSNDNFIYKNLSWFSGSMQWSKDLQKKLTSPVEELQKVEQYFVESDEYKYTLGINEEMKDLLLKFEEYILEKWKDELNKLDKKMDENLFLSDSEGQMLLNFDTKISEVAYEIHYLKQIKKENLLPDKVQKYDKNFKSLLLAQSLLACSIRWYNDLNQNLVEYERKLVFKQWNEIESLLKQGQSKTWNSDVTAQRMKQVLQENLELFKSNPNSGEWKSYTSYLETMIEEGLTDTIRCSLQYILKNTDPQNKKIDPFYKVSMHLEEDIVFKPSLKYQKEGSLFNIFESVLEQIYSLSNAIKCLSKTDSTYYDFISQNEELASLKSSIMKNISSGANKALIEAEKFKKYSALWLKDINEVLEDFVLHGPMMETEIEDEDEFIEETVFELKPPTEEEFRNEIAQFDQLYRKLDDIPPLIEIESWLLLDAISFKESLLNLIRVWTSTYKKKLTELKSLGKLRKIEDEGDL